MTPKPDNESRRAGPTDEQVQFACPDCSQDLTRPGGGIACPDCGYVPRQGAD